LALLKKKKHKTHTQTKSKLRGINSSVRLRTTHMSVCMIGCKCGQFVVQNTMQNSSDNLRSHHPVVTVQVLTTGAKQMNMQMTINYLCIY